MPPTSLKGRQIQWEYSSHSKAKHPRAELPPNPFWQASCLMAWGSRQVLSETALAQGLRVLSWTGAPERIVFIHSTRWLSVPLILNKETSQMMSIIGISPLHPEFRFCCTKKNSIFVLYNYYWNLSQSNVGSFHPMRRCGQLWDYGRIFPPNYIKAYSLLFFHSAP